MRERAQLLGGILGVRSRAGEARGTDRCTFRFPLGETGEVDDEDDSRIAVVLVDDHALVREGVREILSVEQDIVVVGEAADSEDAIARVVEHRPDVVLLDVQIPGRQATETVARIRPCPRRARSSC